MTLLGRAFGFAVKNILPDKLVWIFARRFIAGKDFVSALSRIKALNSDGFSVSIDYIGEECEDPALILSGRREYLHLVDAIHSHKIDADISIKLSRFGLLQKGVQQKTRALGIYSLKSILYRAAALKIRVWIDAERLDMREETWNLVSRYPQFHRWLGVCVQAYAEDSYEFMKSMIGCGYKGSDSVTVRVCKGAYSEPSRKLYTDKALEENFVRLCELALDNDLYLQIATNDDHLAERVDWIGTREYGMLLGANPRGAKRLLRGGCHVRIYAPYGVDFKGYVARRIAERPEYILLPFRR